MSAVIVGYQSLADLWSQSVCSFLEIKILNFLYGAFEKLCNFRTLLLCVLLSRILFAVNILQYICYVLESFGILSNFYRGKMKYEI